MDVDCEGCAGCCVDWREVAPPDVDLTHERRGGLQPLDDAYNLVPLTSDEVRGFLAAGLGDAMTPRLFADAGRSDRRERDPRNDERGGAERRPASGAARSERDPRGRTTTEGSREPSDVAGETRERAVTVDCHDLAAVAGRPAFFVGLRTAPKPVAPARADPAWLPTCVFLDPATLQCRLHGGDRYPETCGTYPRDNLALDVETECERVEAAFGGARLLDDDPGDADPSLGAGALGATVFAHPEPSRLSGRIDRIAAGAPTPADRAEFVAVAAASRPGSLEVNAARYERARERALAADSWVGDAREEWTGLADERAPDPGLGAVVEDRRGAPPTPGWD